MKKDFKPVVKVLEKAYEIPQLKRTRRISALLPYSYGSSTKKYPVLYLHDGQNLFGDGGPFGSWKIDLSLATLAKNGFGEVIIIAIDHGGEERINEYMPYFSPQYGQGEGPLYIRFLIERLKPYIDKNYRTLSDRENTGIGGSSMGGLISLYTGIIHDETFGKMMVFSPSLWISQKIFFHAANFLPEEATDLYIYAGGKESKNHLSNVIRLKSELFKKGHDYSNLRFELSINPKGTHSEKHWEKEFPKALKWLYFEK